MNFCSISLVVILVLSGCSGFSGPNSSEPTTNISQNQTETIETVTPTVTPTLTVASTPTATPNPGQTDTKNQSYKRKEKYGYFRDGYIEGMEEGGVDVINNSIDSNNETLDITYKMRDPESDLYTGRERENISFRYVAATDFYINGNVSYLDKSWVPKHVNITAITPEGKIYETAYTTYERAKKMIDGEISARRYLLKYYSTIEPGPANPEYEG